MKGFITPLVLLMTSLAMLPTPTMAQREQLFIGARPMALGETFVAVADDGYASYWNPAGLAFILRQELNSLYNDLYGLGINNGFLSLLHPLSLRHAVGGNWLYDGFDDGELGYSRNLFTFSYGFAINNHFALGANLKYLQLRVNLDDSMAVAKGNGFGADLGALFTYTFKKRTFPKKVQLGIMAHDITDTAVKYKGGNGSDTMLRRNIRYGAAVQPFDELKTGWLTLSEPLLAIDLDDRWHVGAELWLNRTLALRGGIQNDLDPREGAILSFGTGIRWQFLQFDYAYTVPPTLGETHRFSVSLRSEENPRWVSIDEVDLNEIFASLYLAYQKKDSAHIGTAFVKNTHEEPLTAVVSLNVKNYMTAATEREIELAPGQVTPVRLHAYFADNILDIAGHGKSLKAELKVHYRYKDHTPEDRKTVDFFVHGAGAINWADPGRAAAFVTQLHPCVRAFAERVLASYPLPENVWIAHESKAVRQAMLLFAALRSLKLGYLSDPNRDIRTIDTIHYPYSYLNGHRKAGDCDDLTVLYASLLENCGIETAFLSTRDHFFLMFNTGLHHARPVPYDEALFVAWKNTWWMPIETTVATDTLDGDFGQAWAEGAAKYYDQKSKNDLEALLVTEHQRRYPAPDFAEASPCLPPVYQAAEQYGIISPDSLDEKFPGLEKKTRALLNRLYAEARQFPESLTVRNHIGIVWALVGDEQKAEREFLQVVERDSNYVPARNNLANVKFILEDFNTADSLYAHALSLDPYLPGIYLNRAILAQIRREDAQEQNELENVEAFQQLSDSMMTEAARRLEADTTRAYALLGFMLETENSKAGIPNEIKERIRKVKRFIDRAFRQYLKHKFVRETVLEAHGTTKGIEDEDRGVTLWWSR
jgi:tetratricopeptide (TPR) repeat protein